MGPEYAQALGIFRSFEAQIAELWDGLSDADPRMRCDDSDQEWSLSDNSAVALGTVAVNGASRLMDSLPGVEPHGCQCLGLSSSVARDGLSADCAAEGGCTVPKSAHTDGNSLRALRFCMPVLMEVCKLPLTSRSLPPFRMVFLHLFPVLPTWMESAYSDTQPLADITNCGSFGCNAKVATGQKVGLHQIQPVGMSMLGFARL